MTQSPLALVRSRTLPVELISIDLAEYAEQLRAQRFGERRIEKELQLLRDFQARFHKPAQQPSPGATSELTDDHQFAQARQRIKHTQEARRARRREEEADA